MILGLGAGWNQEECDAYGIDLPPLRERFDRFDEGTEAIVRLLSDTVTTFEGRYVQLSDARCEPKPVQRPHPPIAIGGTGETRTLRTVARFAQHWNGLVPDVATWQVKRDVLWQHCADIGRDPAEIETSVNVRYEASAGPSAAAETAARWAEAGVDVAIFALPTPHDPAVVGPIADAVEAAGLA